MQERPQEGGWSQGEVSPSWALTAGERQQMPLGAEAIMASTQNPAEPGAVSPAGDCPGGRAGLRGEGKGYRHGGCLGCSFFPQHPSCCSPTHLQLEFPVRNQAPQGCPCLPVHHPSGPNSNTEGIIRWLLLNTCNWVLPAFVQQHLLQCLEHR